MPVKEKPKPTFDKFVTAVKNNFPFSEVTQEQVEELRTVYGDCTRNDLVKAYKSALRQNSFDPIQYIYTQLLKYRPNITETDAKNRNYINGKTVEQGTDWQAKYAEIDRQNAIKRQNYDAKHGVGSYDRNMKQYRADLHKYFVGLCDKKTSSKELQPLSKKVDQNGKELGIEAYQ